MRVRETLAIVAAIAMAALFAACGHSFQKDGARGTLKSKDMDVIIWLDSQCRPYVTDPAIAYDNMKVTFRIRGECKRAETLIFSAADGLTDTCSNPQKPCHFNYPNDNPKYDLMIHIKQGASSASYPFHYKLMGTTIKIDPDLEIDP